MTKKADTGTTSRSKPSTIRDVAKLAGVGVGTVSRVVNDTGYVKEETRKRIHGAIRELNFEPNTVAASLRGASSRIIGIVVPDISNPLFASIIKSLEQRLRGARYTVMLTSPAGDPSSEIGIVESLLSRRVEGIFIAPCVEENPALAEVLLASGIPCVVIDRYFQEGRQGFAHIMTDHSKGTLTAVRHLVETGHRRIFFPYVSTNRPGCEREAAFRKGLAEAGGMVSGISVAGSQYTSFAMDETLRQLEGDAFPDAILVGHNQMLSKVLAALREKEIKVGRDISVISCDRTDLGEFHDPPIAGIVRDLGRIGEIAFDLFQLLNSRTSPLEPVYVTTSYIPTASVRQRLTE